MREALLKSCCKLFFLVLVSITASFNLVAFEQLTEKQPLNAPLTIAINETSYPYHFLDKHGKADGLMPDLWRLWAKKQQVAIKFVTLPWLETIKQVKEGKVDIHAGLTIIDSRKDYLGFSRPIFPLYTHLYVNADLLQVKNVKDLTPYAIGVVEGSAHIDLLTKNFPQLKQKMYFQRHELYDAAIKKEVLVFTGLEKLSSNYQYYQQLISMYPSFKKLRYKQADYGVAVAKANEDLLTFIQLGMDKISSAEKANLERKWFGLDKRKDSLTIAFPPDCSPYSARSPTGQAQGFIIDMWRLWAEATDTKITFVSRSTEESLSLINNDNVDVLAVFPNASFDKKHFSLTKAIYQSKAKMFISKKIPNITTLTAFEYKNANYKIGIWQNSTFIAQFLEKFPRMKPQYYPTFDALLKAAELGEVDMFVANNDMMNLKLLKANLQSFFYTLDLPILSSTLSPLIKKDNIQLARIIDEGFKRIEASKLISLEERWLGEDNHYYKDLLNKVSLTSEEEQFIAQSKSVSVGFLTALEPIAFINEEGEFSGIDRDILDIIAQRTGLRFNFIGFDTWHQLYKSMLAGDIDIIPSITPTTARKEYMLFSKDYWDTPWIILHPKFLGRQLKLVDFYDKELALVKDFYLADYLRDNHPRITLKSVENLEEGLRMIQQGKVEGMIENLSSASQLINEERLVTLAISFIEEVPTGKSHFGIQKYNPLLASIIDKGVVSVGEEENAINEKWFSVDINTGFDKDLVMRIALQVTLLIILILGIIIMWNRRLKKEVNHRKQLEEQMKYMATHDDLTGLANRVLLKDRISTAIEFHHRQSLQMAVLFLDLDGFKNVNDSHGHYVGDELLLMVANRLQTCVRKSDTVVRFGGDEFVLLLTGLHHSDEAIFVAEKVLYLLQSPFELSSTKVQIGCSIGIAMFPNDGINDTELLKVADNLMYKAKSSGKNGYLMTT